MFENIKDAGFWVRYYMESGRGYSVIEDTYEFLLYKDGYKEEDREFLSNEAYNWAYYDMNGRELMRFNSMFEIVERPPKEWLHKEYDRLATKMEVMRKMRTLIADEILLEK